MAVNTFKNQPKKQSGISNKSAGMSLFSLMEKYVRVGGLFEQGLPVKYIPYILYITAIGIIYIANRNYAEKTTSKLNKLKTQVDDLRTDYITQSAELMISSKQSEVAKRVKTMDLYESEIPPTKIILEKK